MSNFKKICNLSWCKKHSACIFKNAESVLKTDAYEVALGNNINSAIILCYQKEDSSHSNNARYLIAAKTNEETEREIDEPKPKYEQIHCERTNCRSLADVKFNDKFFLCYNCVDLLRTWKTNHELGKYYLQRNNLNRLFKQL